MSHHQEIGPGLTLYKRVEPSYKDFQVLDQTNVYTLESKLDKEVELTVDITGSEGASIEGTY
jgi:hypothetical protein